MKNLKTIYQSSFFPATKYLWLLIFIFANPALAQKFFIRKIEVEGNKKTKSYIILREINFHQNDSLTYDELKNKFSESKKNLYNTYLFNEIKCSVFDSTEKNISIKIELKERFYTYFIPLAELVDRNFNVWWVDENHNLARLNVGGTFIQRNIRGRNETFTATAQLGFVNQLSVQYEFPFINKSLNKGLVLYSNIFLNKEVNYTSINNKQIFYRDNNKTVFNKNNFGMIFRYRKKIFTRHSLELNFTNYSAVDTISKLNPNFFLKAKTSLNYFLLRYTFEIDHRDVKPYPWNGYYASIWASQFQFLNSNLNTMTDFNLLLSKYTSLKKKWSLFNSIRAKISTPTQQPYAVQRGLGYLNDYVRGYEYYVIDGQRFALFHNDLKWKIFDKMYKTKIPYLEQFPFQIYMKAIFDAAYVTDKIYYPQNNLNNSWQYASGLGVDFVTAYDIRLRCEYMWAKNGGHDIYFHVRAMF